MTAGPGDETASAVGGHGRQRASHSDREQVIEVLKAAFVQDRLTMDELDVRVGRVFTARTYAELAALTADIPAEPATAAPPRTPARPPGNRHYVGYRGGVPDRADARRGRHRRESGREIGIRSGAPTVGCPPARRAPGAALMA